MQIINYNLDLMTMNQMSQQIAEAAKTGEELGPVGGIDIGRSLRLWLNLQNSLNGLYDTTSAEGTAAGGQVSGTDQSKGLIVDTSPPIKHTNLCKSALGGILDVEAWMQTMVPTDLTP